MSSERIPQHEHIALLLNGENGSQDFDEEYPLHLAGTYLHVVLCAIPFTHYTHAA